MSVLWFMGVNISEMQICSKVPFLLVLYWSYSFSESLHNQYNLSVVRAQSSVHIHISAQHSSDTGPQNAWAWEAPPGIVQSNLPLPARCSGPRVLNISKDGDLTKPQSNLCQTLTPLKLKKFPLNLCRLVSIILLLGLTV